MNLYRREVRKNFKNYAKNFSRVVISGHCIVPLQCYFLIMWKILTKNSYTQMVEKTPFRAIYAFDFQNCKPLSNGTLNFYLFCRSHNHAVYQEPVTTRFSLNLQDFRNLLVHATASWNRPFPFSLNFELKLSDPSMRKTSSRQGRLLSSVICLQSHESLKRS